MGSNIHIFQIHELNIHHHRMLTASSENVASSSERAISQESSESSKTEIKPVVILTLGMAGSGKTRFMQRINAWLHAKEKSPYVINLDPAVFEVPYPTNIDIRDSVKYKEVMKQYQLGPNGGIITSLNLFATKFDQVSFKYISKQVNAMINAYFMLHAQQHFSISLDITYSAFCSS